MFKRFNVYTASALIAISSLAIPTGAYAQEAQAAGEPEYKEGVYVGETSDYTTDSVVPADEAVMSADNPDLQKMTQKERAEQLGNNDPYGGALTILSMCIVVMALVVLSILFLCFGKISSALQRKRKQEAHGPSATIETTATEEDSGEVIAAIAAALAEHYSGKHDMEDYILTIRNMKRSYSPWNSKIYNLRVTPQVKH